MNQHEADVAALPEEARQIEADFYLNQLEAIAQSKVYQVDPAFLPLSGQAQNSLRHVTYDFSIAGDSKDYPYELNGRSAYPADATERALTRTKRFIEILRDESVEPIEEVEFPEGYRESLQTEQDEIVKAIMDDPLPAYDDFSERRQNDGDEAPFPELGATLKALHYDLLSSPSVKDALGKSALLERLHARVVRDAKAKIDEGIFAYGSTIHMIEDITALFDIVVRVNDDKAPATFHSANFEYNWHDLAENKEHTLLPTMASVTSADLLKLRGVPVGVIGVSTDTITVDGFPQTPYEFFHHDVDHTRRMHHETQLAVEREGIPARQYYEEATTLLQEVLLPAVGLEGIPEEDQDERDRRIAMRMVLFEILHEDAYDVSRDTIADAVLRAPMERTPFEKLVNEKTVEYFMAPRASTLAHVYRKLAHTFYDLPEKRSTSLGTDFVRTRSSISQAAADLYRLVSDDPISDEDLLTACRELVSSDEGFTDGFIGNIAHDIRRRAVGRNALSLMISRPLPVHAAVRQARRQGRDVHSLFGYAALEYEDHDSLEETVASDLAAFDPEETAIAIGATPYGIGKLYPVVKDLGFYTLGIVSSTAVGRNEECMEGVDEIVVVKDPEWGGYRYNRSDNGLLSPTTRVFAGASDSIGAYGGGNITAVTMREMIRRGKPVSFTPFDMNHRIAEMMQAQAGDSGEIDYRGPAHTAWQDLNQAT